MATNLKIVKAIVHIFYLAPATKEVITCVSVTDLITIFHDLLLRESLLDWDWVRC